MRLEAYTKLCFLESHNRMAIADGRNFLDSIKALIGCGNYKISDHALNALLEDDLERTDVDSLDERTEVIEFYPKFAKGPAILLLQRTADGRVVHCVWGIPKGSNEPAVLITAYIPDPSRWDAQLKERRS